MEARSRRTPPAIPGYRIERPLGDGGMATAWLAVQLSLGREVALKVLDPLLAADAEFVERFVREARLLASLRHRHIVAIHDVGVADGLPYLAMEFLHHGSILPLCGHCDAATALRCVREIADALGHAHAARRHGPQPLGPAGAVVRGAALAGGHRTPAGAAAPRARPRPKPTVVTQAAAWR